MGLVAISRVREIKAQSKRREPFAVTIPASVREIKEARKTCNHMPCGVTSRGNVGEQRGWPRWRNRPSYRGSHMKYSAKMYLRSILAVVSRRAREIKEDIGRKLFLLAGAGNQKNLRMMICAVKPPIYPAFL